MDEQLKKRLLGAVVLLSLAVLLIPVFFGPDSEPPVTPPRMQADGGVQLPGEPPAKPAAVLDNPFIEIPPQETPGTRTAGQTPPAGQETLPLEELAMPGVALQDPVTPGPIPVGRVEPKTQLATPPARTVPKEEPTPKVAKAKPAEKPKVEPAPKTAKAEKPAAKPAKTEKTAQANPAPERLAKLMPQETTPKLKPQTKPAGQESRKAAAPDPVAGAWAVQVGSFNDKIKADILRQELQVRRMPAFVTTARVDGKLMYRVRVGPNLNREQADRWRERLERDMNLNANVVKHR